ncbi:glycosyltransferase [Leuconostoc suionicum]|uniref:glycosyltransferase n=1 Tax=Leuconostoc suionicum TaxID=1511761 RepID=UPI00233F73EE|nr:glycosyltransferase [Leuconostoc suionicum]MDC2816372.1 glycosyltransferase [Leuconostoc suionicum]
MEKMINNNSIAILMSTYNGDKFLEEQIISIFRQRNIGKVHLFVRDDGSSDNTLKLLSKIKNRYNNQITIIPGENVGYAKSFFELMKLPQLGEYDYIGLSDQDDTWKENKLDILTKSFKYSRDVPQLVFSNGIVVAKQKTMGKIYEVPPVTRNIISVRYRAFYGMTFLFNRTLLNVILESNIDDISGLGHDDWIMMVVVNVGEIIYVDQPLVNYRQHSNNASGIKTSAKNRADLSKILQVIMNLKNRLKHWSLVNSSNANYALEHIDEECMLVEQKDFLKNISEANKNLSVRVRLLYSKQLNVGSLAQNVILKILLISKKI